MLLFLWRGHFTGSPREIYFWISQNEIFSTNIAAFSARWSFKLILLNMLLYELTNECLQSDQIIDGWKRIVSVYLSGLCIHPSVTIQMGEALSQCKHTVDATTLWRASADDNVWPFVPWCRSRRASEEVRAGNCAEIDTTHLRRGIRCCVRAKGGFCPPSGGYKQFGHASWSFTLLRRRFTAFNHSGPIVLLTLFASILYLEKFICKLNHVLLPPGWVFI